MKSSRGQGLVELLVGLPLCLLVVGALISLLYRSVLFHSCQYHAHEALICTQDQNISLCQKELEARLKKVLLSSVPWKVSFQDGFRRVSVRIEIYLDPVLTIQSSIPKA